MCICLLGRSTLAISYNAIRRSEFDHTAVVERTRWKLFATKDSLRIPQAQTMAALSASRLLPFRVKLTKQEEEQGTFFDVASTYIPSDRNAAVLNLLKRPTKQNASILAAAPRIPNFKFVLLQSKSPLLGRSWVTSQQRKQLSDRRPPKRPILP